MDVLHDLVWTPPLPNGSVVTLGQFDGVHRGQRVILHETSRTAALEGCPSAVVTFDVPVSDATSRDEERLPRLTTLEQKLELFEAIGVDLAVVLPADRMTSTSSPGVNHDKNVDWIFDELFASRLRARTVVVREDFDFIGSLPLTFDTFIDRSESGAFRIVPIPIESRRTAAGEIITASAIRGTLASGNVELAAKMLGRPYEIRSVVTQGERRGRTIGFPTANLPVDQSVQLPGDGVYACWYVRPDGARFRAAVNVGKRPTFASDNATSLIEAHLLDFSGDLYTESARLQFVERLRTEQKFVSIEALRQQLARDVDRVNDRLRAHSGFEFT